jgi:hypothetical protein
MTFSPNDPRYKPRVSLQGPQARDRVRQFIAEARASAHRRQVVQFLAGDRRKVKRAGAGPRVRPVVYPDYSGNPVKQLEMFGDPDLYLLERNLSDLCITLTKDHGFTIRFIAFPFDESFARDKGYSRQIWADRLVTLQQLAEDLGDRFQIALRRRASDSNTWITGDLGHIESRKGDPAESRGYDRATLDTDGPTIFRAIRCSIASSRT